MWRYGLCPPTERRLNLFLSRWLTGDYSSFGLLGFCRIVWIHLLVCAGTDYEKLINT